MNQTTEVEAAESAEVVNDGRQSSRRAMLRLTGVAAAAAIAATARSSDAHANDGDPLAIGQLTGTNPGIGTGVQTGLVYRYTNMPKNGAGENVDIFAVRTKNTFLAEAIPTARPTSSPAVISGSALLGVVEIGVRGESATAAGVGVMGDGGTTGTGVVATGGRAPIWLTPRGPNPGVRTDAHRAGELLVDNEGRLYFCRADGTPGSWIQLGAGQYHPVLPTRVYDSRVPQPSPGRLAVGASRTLTIGNGRSITDGSVTTPNLVPGDATSVTANVTVVNTARSGFLAINPASVTEVRAATINWFGDNQILNNGVNLTIFEQELTVVAGGESGASTDFVIDITGYFV